MAANETTNNSAVNRQACWETVMPPSIGRCCASAVDPGAPPSGRPAHNRLRAPTPIAMDQFGTDSELSGPPVAGKFVTWITAAGERGLYPPRHGGSSID